MQASGKVYRHGSDCGIKQAIVKATKGTDFQQAVTDSHGNFTLDSLDPGQRLFADQ